MKNLTWIAALLVAICFGSVASAKTWFVTPGDPIATIEFPDNWTVGEIKRGLEIKSNDEEVFLWIEIYRPSAYAAVVREHERYFQSQGVRIIGEPTQQSSREDGVSIKYTDFPATWQGKPTVLRYLAIDLGLPSGKEILMSYWASPEGDKKHSAAMDRVLDSFKVR